MVKNIRHEEKSVNELKKALAELMKKIILLEKEAEIAKLKLLKMGIKEDDLKQFSMQQKSKKKRDFIVKPIHPGAILREELLIPHDISPEELAQEIKVPKETVKWVCEERESITLDLAKRLSIYFNTSLDLWLNLQRSYEEELLEVKFESLEKEIIPYKEKYTNGRCLQTN